MHYITQDENGLITARYIADIHGDNIPADAIEVDEGLWRESVQMVRPALINGELVEMPLPKPTQDELAQQAKAAIYRLLDETAQQYDYRNFSEVALFANSEKWEAEAKSLIAWQETVWSEAYELLELSIVSVDEFMARLPKYVSKLG